MELLLQSQLGVKESPQEYLADRVRTIKRLQDDTKPEDLNHPGHVFPLRAKAGGVLEEMDTQKLVRIMGLAN